MNQQDWDFFEQQPSLPFGSQAIPQDTAQWQATGGGYPPGGPGGPGGAGGPGGPSGPGGPGGAGGPGGPGGPGARPGGAPPLDPQLQRLLTRLLQEAEAGFPIPEVIESLHHDVMRDPTLRDLPAMRRFTDARLNEIHSELATCGYIRRILSGDRSPTALPGLQEALTAQNDAHTAALGAFRELAAAPQAARNPAVQALSQVLPMDTQIHRRIAALAAPLMRLRVPPAPAVPGTTPAPHAPR